MSASSISAVVVGEFTSLDDEVDLVRRHRDRIERAADALTPGALASRAAGNGEGGNSQHSQGLGQADEHGSSPRKSVSNSLNCEGVPGVGRTNVANSRRNDPEAVASMQLMVLCAMHASLPP
ncbi:MAG: hypothetical protein IPI67_24320 [Myxococcales bacterium]|nr:hypothetical protein [Myxococcales bacterium]